MSLFTPEDYENPQWDAEDKVHCWRNYVSYAMKDIWSSLTVHQKRIIAENLQSIADDEQWE